MKNTETLKMNYEFRRIYNKGRYFAGKFLVLYALSNNKNFKRLGITVSKKSGKSVRRNRIRRLIRENYRLMEDRIKDGFDMVFVVRSTTEMPDFRDIRDEMVYLLKKLDMISKESTDCLQES